MKLVFFLLVFLENGMKPTAGQLFVLHSSRELILRTYFDSYYDLFEKTCCKFQQSYCVDFVNNRGQLAPEYEGRILVENYIGVFIVKLINLSITDAGKYRCGVSGFASTYDDFELTISELQRFFEVSGNNQSPKSSLRPNIQVSTLGPQLGSEKHTEEHSESENMVPTLAALCSVVAFAVIVSITLLVFHLKKSREKSGTCGFCDNTPQQSSQEQDGTIYSSVLFKSYEDLSELYVNLQAHRPKHTVPSSACVISTGESVEYSTVLRAPT
ncbi:uncharacterized protein LOC130567930 isoform X3 [Triplophysa rosa]|uniref:uncharacterized protein LOC130567930 isoform X3 n=1 Tax=Triplophysa rosa TaxID=992332 RepID=UPI00254622A1|nr:uncharacterized protein LOC130567930 isoform X3 [Triplophysa rosa]